MQFIGVTLYNPELKQIEYIKLLGEKQKNSKIIIIDNTLQGCNAKGYFEEDNIIYVADGINYGLSVAFNKIIDISNEIIKERNEIGDANYLLLIDQDSQFDLNILDAFLNEVIKRNDEKIGIYSCRTSPQNEVEFASSKYSVTFQDWVISSGSVLNLNVVIKKNIRYDENIFIDHVDYDFCNRLKSHQLSIITLNNYFFTQKLGYIYKNNCCHSPIRFYYMMRDQLYLNSKYSSSRIKNYYYNLKSIRNYIILVFSKEDNKIKKIQFILRGIFDYTRGKRGEYVK